MDVRRPTQISTALEFDVNSKIDKLMAEIQRRDRALAELQAAYERAMADKVDMQEEVQKIQKLGDAAGRVQQTTNISSSRYELSGPAAASGSSQDPLAQAQGQSAAREQTPVHAAYQGLRGCGVPSTARLSLGFGWGPAARSHTPRSPLRPTVPLQNDFSMRGPRPDTVTSTDQLGEHTTASPLVEPLVVGERPVAQNSQSSRFSDWRPTSSRSSTRVTQAPGGSSAQISQIFG